MDKGRRLFMNVGESSQDLVRVHESGREFMRVVESSLELMRVLGVDVSSYGR